MHHFQGLRDHDPPLDGSRLMMGRVHVLPWSLDIFISTTSLMMNSHIISKYDIHCSAVGPLSLDLI